jgi:phage terminase large subunit-like protein
LLDRPFMPWQQLVSDVAGEIDPSTGRFVYEIVDVVSPRQSGRTTLAVATLIQRGGLRKMARGWYTAQTRQDAADKFVEDWVPLIEDSAMRRLVTIRKANGSERLTVRNTRSTIGLFPPTRKGLHGKQADTVFVDEAWAFDVLQGADIETGARPAQITRMHRQLWRLSAAGDHRSSYLDELMDSGRALVQSGRPSKRAYFEWSAPLEPGDSFDIMDRALWWAAHPALGHTIDEEALVAEAENMDPVEFARSYLCIPTRITEAAAVISAEDWEACASPSEDQPASVCFAADATPERSSGAIAVCGRRRDGSIVVELVDHKPGVDWIGDRLVELVERHDPLAVVVDRSGPAGTSVGLLERSGVEVTIPAAHDVAQAAEGFYDAVTQRQIVHQSDVRLGRAVAGAKQRPIGQAWGWDRRGTSDDISPLVAASFALWGFLRSEAQEPGVW